MGLKTGLYLVSNIHSNPMQSIFEEVVSPINDRNDQWDRILQAGAFQRLCRSFKNKSEYEKLLAEVNYNLSKNKKRIIH
jgi:hypothetical protein